MCECKAARLRTAMEEGDEQQATKEIDDLVADIVKDKDMGSLTAWEMLRALAHGVYYLTLMKYTQPEKYEFAKRIHEELLKQHA